MPIRHVKKIMIKRKDAYPKKDMPHAHKECQKEKKRRERKYSPYQKKEDMRERNHANEFLHYPPKISTHLHILIKVYDFFSFGSGL